MDRAGIFHHLPRFDDARLEEIFAREVLELLVELGGEVRPDHRLAAAGIGRPGRPRPFIGGRRRA